MSVLDGSKGSSIGRVTLLDEGILDVPVLHGQPLQMEGSLHSSTPWLGKALALPSWRKAHWNNYACRDGLLLPSVMRHRKRTPRYEQGSWQSFDTPRPSPHEPPTLPGLL